MPGGLAARVMGWQRRMGAGPGPFVASGEQPTGDPVTVEIYVGGLWVDITPYVMTRDGSTRIDITIGRTSEGGQIDPGTCRFQLNNRDGRFSPRNPTSPYYGQIGRNTKIRVSVPNGNVKDYRFQGEIPAWPAKWDSTGSDVWVEVEAAGPRRRLSQGATPLKSAMLRELTKPSRTTSLVAYWPCEDASSATTIASGLPGGHVMAITGAVGLAGYSDWPASDSLPLMQTGKFTGGVSAYTATNETSLRMFIQTPTAGVGSTQCIFTLAATGTARKWSLYINSSSQLSLRAYSSGGTAVLSVAFSTFPQFVDGDLLNIGLELTQNGADIDWTLTVFNFTDGNIDISIPTSTQSSTLAGYTVGRITQVTIGEDGALGDTAIGHIALADDLDAYSATGDAMVAWKGETAGGRINRLQGEEEIPFGSVGTFTDSVRMGNQGRDTLLNLIDECGTADMGLVYERWTTFGTGYRNRISLENQSSGLVLTYGPQLSEVPEPVDDDQLIANEITVSRPDGSSAVATLSTGTLSTMDPPNGVGRYDTAVTVNVESDDDLPDQAGWRLHLGTVDEARYPRIFVNLAHPTFTQSTTLRSDALGIHPGDRITISDPPAWLPPETISVLSIGRSESIDQFQHHITYNCVPESPYHVAESDSDDFGRLDTAGSELAAAVTSAATSVGVTTTTGPVWVTSAVNSSEFPFDVMVGGEVWTVTGVSGTDATFETGVGSWTPTNATLVQSSAEYLIGSKSALLTVTGSPTQAYFRPTNANRAIVTPGQSYTITAWVYSVAGYGTVEATIDWYTEAGAFISNTGASFVVPGSEWTRITQTGTAPATAAFAAYGPTLTGSPPTGEALYADQVELTPLNKQSFTVTRSVNGVTKTHAAGTDVRLANPVYIPL